MPKIGKTRTLVELDPRFNYSNPYPDWRKDLGHQILLGTSMKWIEPDKDYYANEGKTVFRLPTYDTILPGIQTRFHVKGTFEMTNQDGDWIPIPYEQGEKVKVCQNWFERRILAFSVYLSNIDTTHLINSEPFCSAAYLNMLAYAHMEPELKRIICLEPAHPGNSCCALKSDFDFDGEKWKEYSRSIFNSGKFHFSYIPLNTFPFYQAGDFANQPQRAVPSSILHDPKIVIQWYQGADKMTFVKRDQTDTTQYRVSYEEMKLSIEIARPNPHISLESRIPKSLSYLGESRKGKSKRTDGTNELNIEFDHVRLPSSILIFALTKAALGNNTPDPEDAKVEFLKHQIDFFQLLFNEHVYYSSKTMPQLENLGMEIPLVLQTHTKHPILGIPIDKEKTSGELLVDDGKNYSFPHQYVRLSAGYDQRMLPEIGSMSDFQREGKLTVLIHFLDGAHFQDNAQIACFLMYAEDANLHIDVLKKLYNNPYNIQ